MRLHMVDGTRLLIDLKAAGLLKAMAHSPTLRVVPEPFGLDLEGDRAAVNVQIRAEAIELPDDMSDGDRARMRDNLRGAEVLDARRWPTIEFRGRYDGTDQGGTLAGALVLRGAQASVAMPVRVQRQWDVLAAEASWEGPLTRLGIRPFKALLGAIKLEDWIRLRVEARFREG
ncbi:MAG TPA: YceI family protein [Polyangiaceae bacterium]|jgi:polyisoprenoid-binding protein YceI|nr:YceI family protein [Polyangiaceae bacterium]